MTHHGTTGADEPGEGRRHPRPAPPPWTRGDRCRGPEDLRLQTIRDGGVVAVIVRGDVDLAGGHRLCDTLLGALQSGADRVLVDVSGVTFLDVPGWRALLLAARRGRERGCTLVLVAPSPPVRRLLEVLQPGDEVPQAATMVDALRLPLGPRRP